MMQDDLDGELDAYLDEHDFAPVVVAAVEDAINAEPIKYDESQINAMLARRARLLAEIDRVKQLADERVAPIYAWRDDRVVGARTAVDTLDTLLEQFARKALPEKDVRSLAFPHGTLTLTAPGKASVVVQDEGEFVAWVLGDDEREPFLRRNVEVDKNWTGQELRVGPFDVDASTDDTNVHFAINEDGEKVPGIRFAVPATDRFGIKQQTQPRKDNG